MEDSHSEMGMQVKEAKLSRSFHFVLVHGACFGGWCWYKLARLLTKAGHTVSSLDMAGGGIHPRDADTITTLQEYNQPLTDFFSVLPSQDKVILVGHSAGGFNLSLSMEQFPHKIAAAVFVAAFMPLSGTTFSHGLNQDITLTESLLRRFPLWQEAIHHGIENYGSVRRAYIVAEEDNLVVEELQRKIITDNRPHMVYEIEGSDHCTFFCKPERLAEVLLRIGSTFICDCE